MSDRPKGGQLPPGELAVMAEYDDGAVMYEAIPPGPFVAGTRAAADRAALLAATEPGVTVARVIMVLAVYPDGA